MFIANCISRTVTLRRTGDYGDATDPWVRVSYRALGTNTFEGSGQIVTDCTSTTSIRFAALVQIHTKSFRISSETWWTLTRITAGYILADRIITTLARRPMNLIAFVYVHTSCCDVTWIERPAFFAYAISLHTVRFAEGMWSAGDIFARRFALHTGRSAHVAGKAIALERTRGINALGIRSAKSSSRATLVNIYTDRTVRLKSILAEALTIDTFGVVRTIEIAATLNRHVTLHTS